MVESSLIEDLSTKVLEKYKNDKDVLAIVEASDKLIKDFNSKEEIEDLVKFITKADIDGEFDLLCSLESMESNMGRRVKSSEYDRYSDILPYKYNNVNLSSKRYINASWIHTPFNKAFISTQGPKSSTVKDFWTMVNDYDVKLIVMLCNIEEGERIKCHEYWPSKGSLTLENGILSIIKEEKLSNNIIRRSFELKVKEEKKLINQIHYIGWPDHGVPDIDKCFEDFLILIKETNLEIGNSPVAVHCSAGIGRTGTFISLLNMFHLFKKKSFNFNVFDTVRKIKECRCYSVENINQYAFIYGIMNKYFKSLLK